MAVMTEVASEQEMREFGERLGALFSGGELIELVGDVGAGKTTLVRGIAQGMRIDETVQSPSFTINRVYDAPEERRLVHYDFYRLSEPGIMQDELRETMSDPKSVVVIEWADSVEEFLPADRLTITIRSTSESSRQLEMVAGGQRSAVLLEALA